jgi:hypothetical protein
MTQHSDTATIESIKAVGPPCSALTVSGRGAAGDDQTVPIVRQDILDGDLERVIGQRATTTRVVHHLIPAPIDAGNRAIAGHMPHDVIGERRGERSIITHCPCVVLVMEEPFIRMHQPNEREQAEQNLDLGSFAVAHRGHRNFPGARERTSAATNHPVTTPAAVPAATTRSGVVLRNGSVDADSRAVAGYSRDQRQTSRVLEAGLGPKLGP